VEHGILVRGDLEVLGARLIDHALRIAPELGIEAQVANPLIPPPRLPVARQIDEPVARNALLADGVGQPAELVGALEVTGRLEEAERPAGRQRRAPEQFRQLAHHPAHVAADEDVPHQRARGRSIDDAHAAVGSPDADLGLRGVVEEKSVTAMGDEERNAHVRAGPMAQMGVPELTTGAEPIETSAPLAQSIEVLLPGKLEGGVHATVAVGIRGLTARAVAVLGLAEQPSARGVEEAQPSAISGCLHGEIGGGEAERLAFPNLKGHGGPASLTDIGRRGSRRSVLEGHANDAGGADGEGDPLAIDRDSHGRSTALEARRAGGGTHERRL